MRVLIRDSESRKEFGALRLRDAIRFTNRTASLRATDLLGFFLVALSVTASATTYYVSSSTGNDANNGTSALTAWQTIGHVNGQTFLPGDSILFQRGDVWNESLAPPSSGNSGNSITFDAYGTGAAPNLTGYYAVPSSAWISVSGNAWKAPLPASYTTINFCLFGSIWGQKVAAVSSNLVAQWNFYFANGYVYVYSVGNPGIFYNEPIVPMALSNVPVINVNGQSWLTFQHFLVNWFDQYGVYVQGTSDHLVFANMESDSMIPQGTQPLGFYVNEATPGPGDVKLYNDEAHLNYDGYRFDGTATAITLVNDKGYANRDGALVDNTGAVTYSYCHFYASSLAVAGSTDVEWTSGSGPAAGAGNIAADIPPAVQVWQRYPAIVTLTVDDAGMTPGADTYYADAVLPVADAAGVPVGAAITVGYSLAQTLISEFQSWINAGRDVTSHSISHTYYTNTDALDIQYTGSGSAATLNISGNTLTIAVTGASDSVSYNLAQGQPQGTMLELAEALAATGKFTYSFLTPCQGPYGTGCSAYTAAALLSQDLANVSGQDVKSAVYHMQLNVPQLTSDEITLSRQWMTANLTGLPSTPVYVYPGGYETTAMQGIAEGVPYSGARGALKEDLGVKDTYADGFNVENVTSFGVNPTWMGIPPALLNQRIQALVWKESVWGVPWGIFWHLNELMQDDPVGGTEITNLIGDFKASGATIKTNTGLVNWLLSGTQVAGTDGSDYYVFPATSMRLDFRPTKSSPVVDAGQNLGSAYELDINGVNQNSYGSGWEIGAHVYMPYATYGFGAGSGQFAVGQGQAPSAPQLPLMWVDNNEATDGLVYTPPQYELNLATQTWVTGPPAGCTFHVPYWTVGAPTFLGMQSAINDDEACRTANSGAACTILDIPPTLYATSNANGLVIPQTNASAANCFIVLRSTEDTYLPNGTTICSHGIQDNLASSTDIGLNNPDCTGENMYYALGPSNAGGVINGITTLSANTTTLAAVSTTGTPILVPLANGYVSPGGSYVVDTGSNQETVTAASGVNQTGIYATFSKTHAPGVSITRNVGSFTLANGTASSTSAYNDLQYMWQVQASGTNPSAVTFCNPSGTTVVPECATNTAPDHWLIEDMAASMAPGNTGDSYIIAMNTVADTSMSQLGSHIHLRKVWVHGDWTSTLNGANSVTAGINFGCTTCSLIDSQISQGLRPGNEGHSLQYGYGTNYKIDHNWIEGSSIASICGGFSYPDPSIPGLVPCNDMEFRRDRFTFPYAWLGQSPITGNPNYSAFSLVRKNAFETKSGQRWVVQGVIRENIDNSGAQSGTNGSYKVTNSSTTQGTNYQAVTSDISDMANIYRNSCDAVQVQGRSNALTNGDGASFGVRNILFNNDLLYNVSTTNPGCSTADAFGWDITSTNVEWNGTITRDSTGQIATFVATCAPQISGNCPSGPPPIGFQSVDISAGNLVQISGCTIDTSFNTPTTTYNAHTYPSLGTQAIAGTLPSAQTVVFPSAGTANSVDNSGNCQLSYIQGWPQFLWHTHNTLITDASFALSSDAEYATGPTYARDNLFRDSIFLGGGWFNNDRTAGTLTENFNWDITTLSADHLVWAGQTAANYTEFGNNPAYPDSAGCAAAGCNPPTTMYFPATPYCTGAAVSNCVGFVGAMNISSMPLTLADYHNFALVSSSPYAAGNANAASNGTAMGANIPAIDTAQTQTTYVCATPCGAPGPYHD